MLHIALVHIALLCLELYFIALPRTGFAHFCLQYFAFHCPRIRFPWQCAALHCHCIDCISFTALHFFALNLWKRPCRLCVSARPTLLTLLHLMFKAFVGPSDSRPGGSRRPRATPKTASPDLRRSKRASRRLKRRSRQPQRAPGEPAERFRQGKNLQNCVGNL